MIIDLTLGERGRINFHHHPPYEEEDERGKRQIPGWTACAVEIPVGGNTVRGTAFLHPKDNYCKDTGRKISLAKALRGLPKDERTLIWKAYFKARGKEQYL